VPVPSDLQPALLKASVKVCLCCHGFSFSCAAGLGPRFLSVAHLLQPVNPSPAREAAKRALIFTVLPGWIRTWSADFAFRFVFNLGVNSVSNPCSVQHV
jgi:hypothetical protein